MTTRQRSFRMGLKKKKNIIILTICMVICFILYQLYFFLRISSETSSVRRVIPVWDHSEIKAHLRSEADTNINEHGVIKGVLYSNMPRYRPDSKGDFKCLMTNQKIPFEYVNDDYCDCTDATDEPSTAACWNGTFYCDSQFKTERISQNVVHSSKVNDGICDCCDGSDEWILKPNQKLLTQGTDKEPRHYAILCPNVCWD